MFIRLKGLHIDGLWSQTGLCYGKCPEKLRGHELPVNLFFEMHTHVLIPDKLDIFSLLLLPLHKEENISI